MNSLLFSPKNMALYPHQQSYHHLTSAMKPTDSSYSIHYTFPSRSPIHTILFCKGRSHKKCISRYSSPHGGQEEEDSDRVLRAVLKLYDAIKNKNVGELSEVFGDECRCGCNFLPLPGSFKGKKHVLAFFSYLMRTLGDNIKLEIRPTTQDGMTVGVSWKLEWKKSSLPLGKGFSFHVCQIYQGKVLIRNVEMMMEPLFQIQPLVEKLVAFIGKVEEKTRNLIVLECKTLKRATYILLATILLVVLMFFS